MFVKSLVQFSKLTKVVKLFWIKMVNSPWTICGFLQVSGSSCLLWHNPSVLKNVSCQLFWIQKLVSINHSTQTELTTLVTTNDFGRWWWLHNAWWSSWRRSSMDTVLRITWHMQTFLACRYQSKFTYHFNFKCWFVRLEQKENATQTLILWNLLLHQLLLKIRTSKPVVSKVVTTQW